MKQHPRRRLADAHRLRDLASLEAVQVLEDQRRAVAYVESAQSRLDGVRHLRFGEAVADGGDLAGIIQRRRGSRGSTAEVVVADVHGDPVEPGLGVLPTVRVRRVREGAQEDLLRDVGRIVRIADDAGGKVVDAPSRLAVEPFELLRIGIRE